MVSEDKLIKQGIKLTDAWFEKFKKQIEHDLSLCETYEKFIERTKDYTTANILINSGYAAEMQSLITQILNNHKFQRASQRALIEETINNNVGYLIQDVGEEIKETVRDVVKEGYDEGSHPREIARNINGRIDSINSRRARTIARTEVKRTDTVANYVRHKEQGATGFNVQCRPDCCPLCAKDYAHKDPKKQQARLNRIAQMKRDKVDDPLVRGKGEIIGGNVEFSMDDTLMLPPRHPNCRCTAMFVYGGTVETEEPTETTTTTIESEPVTQEPVKKSNSKLNYEDLKTVEEVAEYFGFEYSYGDFPQIDDEVLIGNDGKKYKIKNENRKGKYHKFYDRENDCTLYFHQSLNKNLKDGLLIDNTNTGKGVYNLKEVVKMYDDAPKVLKEANTSLTFTNRKAKYLGGYNKLVSKKWLSVLKDNPIFKRVAQGRTGPQGWIDIYKTSIKDDGDGWGLQRLIYHEMAHGLDNILSENWGNPRMRFSDNRTADGYGALISKQHNFNEETRKMEVSPEDIVDGISSEYGQRHYDKTHSYSEDFADCVSVVVFKYVEDKTGAKILPPDWSWSNKKPPYTYEEFVKKYPHKVKFIEELLGIDN